MTLMAQELDEKHRILEDREQELKIEFASQEEDGSLLIKQILLFKRQQRQLLDMRNKL